MTSGDDRRPPLWFIYTVTVAGILANTLLTPAIPDVLADFDQPDGRAGLLVAVGPMPGVIVAPIIGVLADRFGRRRVLIPCLVIFGVAGLAAAFAPTFEALLLARLIQGFGSAGLINLAVVLIGDHWTGLERTKLIGRNAAVLTFCLAFVPSIAGIIAQLISWRASLAVASVGIPVALIGLRVLPDTRPDQPRRLSNQLRGAAAVIRQPLVVSVIVAGFFLFVVIFGVFLTTLPVHLEEEFGLEAGARGLVLSTPAIGSTIVAYNLGRIRTFLSMRAVLVVSGALVSIAAFAVGVAPVLVLVLVASVLYGLGDGVAIPTLQDVATTVTPDAQRASVMAAWVAAVRLGQAAGPLAFAAIFAASSTEAAMIGGAALFGLVTVFFAVGPIDDDAVQEAEQAAQLSN